jgi:hypothetical protein
MGAPPATLGAPVWYGDGAAGAGAAAGSRGVTLRFCGDGGRSPETVMVGSTVVSEGADCGAAGAGLGAGVSAAGASGAADGWVGSAGDVCAEARPLSAARTDNAKAH